MSQDWEGAGWGEFSRQSRACSSSGHALRGAPPGHFPVCPGRATCPVTTCCEAPAALLQPWVFPGCWASLGVPGGRAGMSTPAWGGLQAQDGPPHGPRLGQATTTCS